jgi:hypothetical protein
VKIPRYRYLQGTKEGACMNTSEIVGQIAITAKRTRVEHTSRRCQCPLDTESPRAPRTHTRAHLSASRAMWHAACMSERVSIMSLSASRSNSSWFSSKPPVLTALSTAVANTETHFACPLLLLCSPKKADCRRLMPCRSKYSDVGR